MPHVGLGLWGFLEDQEVLEGQEGRRGGGEVLEPDDDASAGNVASREDQKGDILEENATAVVAAEGEGNGVHNDGEGDEEDDDDDFITNKVKRRLKELRKNSFMVLIPGEECAEAEEGGEEEEEGSSSREWMESNVGDGFPLCGFDSLYDKYCERMRVFDKMITQLLKDQRLLAPASRPEKLEKLIFLASPASASQASPAGPRSPAKGT
ncbi:hypothetical protein ACP70R_045990 [Stipagrostis hirtigluma subsp. patula]